METPGQYCMQAIRNIYGKNVKTYLNEETFEWTYDKLHEYYVCDDCITMSELFIKKVESVASSVINSITINCIDDLHCIVIKKMLEELIINIYSLTVDLTKPFIDVKTVLPGIGSGTLNFNINVDAIKGLYSKWIIGRCLESTLTTMLISTIENGSEPFIRVFSNKELLKISKFPIFSKIKTWCLKKMCIFAAK